MRALHAVLVLLATAFVVASVASADAEATKQRVQIDKTGVARYQGYLTSP